MMHPSLKDIFYGHGLPLVKRQKGINLVELMVALALSSFVLLVILNIFTNTRRQIQTQESTARIQENARSALQSLTEDVHMAGYIGTVNQYWNVEETPSTSNKLVTLSDECFLKTGGNTFRWAAPMIAIDYKYIPPTLYGSDGTRLPFSGCISSANYVSNTDVLSLSFATLPRVPNASLQNNTFYIRSNMQAGVVFMCGQAAGTGATGVGIGFAPAASANCLSDALSTSTYAPLVYGGSGSPDTTPDTANYALMSYAFFVRPCSDPGADKACGTTDDGDSTPALVRASIDYNISNCPGSAIYPCITYDVIAEGVVSMQIEYGIDSQVESGVTATAGTVANGIRYGLPDGAVDQYLTAAQIGGGSIFTDAGIEAWNNVLVARIWLLIRSTVPEPGYVDPKSPYSITGETVHSTPGFRHQLFSTTISLRHYSG